MKLSQAAAKNVATDSALRGHSATCRGVNQNEQGCGSWDASLHRRFKQRNSSTSDLWTYSENITNKKGLKRKGKESGADMQHCKKEQRRRLLRMFAVTNERFCRPGDDFTMGDWQQMTERGRKGHSFGKRLTTLLALLCTSLSVFVRWLMDKFLVLMIDYKFLIKITPNRF